VIRQLHDIVVQSGAKNKVIQLVPPDNAIQEVLAVEIGDNLEIGLTKQVYLKLFKQVHQQWHQFDPLQWENNKSAWWDYYYMTLGYLITTNENHTIITLHELLLHKLCHEHGNWVLDNEIELISVFVSSRLKRVNKSSSLWLLMRKLSILAILHRSNEDIQQKFLDRVFMSCQFHFANYYANTFLKWYTGISVVLGQEDYIGERLKTACHQNLKDCSLWSTLAVWIYPDPYLQHYIDQYNQLAGQLGQSLLALSYVKNTSICPGPKLNEIKTQLQWLVRVNCRYMYPYTALLNVVRQSHSDTKQFVEILNEKLTETYRFFTETELKESQAYTDALELARTLEKTLELARNSQNSPPY